MGHASIKTGTCTHFLKYFETPGSLPAGEQATKHVEHTRSNTRPMGTIQLDDTTRFSTKKSTAPMSGVPSVSFQSKTYQFPEGRGELGV